MGTMIGNGNDVISFLKLQHQQVKTMFTSVISAHGEERARAFASLRRMMAVHETAEEEVVHPAARKALPDGESLVQARLREENEAKKALTELEALNVDSAEFTTKIRSLEKNVIAHADAEERDEFNRLASALDPARLVKMRKAAELAEEWAPTHAHAGIESQAGNLLAGPFVALMDRARDAIVGKH